MNNNKILLFGKNGQVGSRLNSLLQAYDLAAFDYPEIDFNNIDQLNQMIAEIKPGLIINASAYTAVDQAEENIELANTINGIAPGVIAQKAKEINAGFIHYSTDYVFDGTKGTPYFESDSPSPLSVYGSSKLLGEKNIQEVDSNFLIFRPSWVYSINFPSFTSSVLSWSRKHEVLRIVDDQISNPTWATMLAEKTVEIVKRYQKNWFSTFESVRGIYHLVNKEPASRFEWAKEILASDPNKEEQLTKTILPAKTVDFPTPATRPLYSGLDCSKFEKTFGFELPHWRISLSEALKEKIH